MKFLYIEGGEIQSTLESDLCLLEYHSMDKDQLFEHFGFIVDKDFEFAGKEIMIADEYFNIIKRNNDVLDGEKLPFIILNNNGNSLIHSDDTKYLNIKIETIIKYKNEKFKIEGNVNKQNYSEIASSFNLFIWSESNGWIIITHSKNIDLKDINFKFTAIEEEIDTLKEQLSNLYMSIALNFIDNWEM